MIKYNNFIQPIYLVGQFNALSKFDSTNYNGINQEPFTENGGVVYDIIDSILSKGFTDLASQFSLPTLQLQVYLLHLIEYKLQNRIYIH